MSEASSNSCYFGSIFAQLSAQSPFPCRPKLPIRYLSGIWVFLGLSNEQQNIDQKFRKKHIENTYPGIQSWHISPAKCQHHEWHCLSTRALVFQLQSADWRFQQPLPTNVIVFTENLTKCYNLQSDEKYIQLAQRPSRAHRQRQRWTCHSAAKSRPIFLVYNALPLCQH